jgi:hypothetical protein
MLDIFAVVPALERNAASTRMLCMGLTLFEIDEIAVLDAVFAVIAFGDE